VDTTTCSVIQGKTRGCKDAVGIWPDVDHPDNFERTPLHTASRCSQDDLVRFLLDHGADPSASYDQNETALHHASHGGGPGVVRLLLDHGSDMNVRGKLGWDPLSNTAGGRYSDGWTPFHRAVIYGSKEVVEVFLDYGADPNAPDRAHMTALHLATLNGRLEIVKTLLARGANPRARTIEGKTPFEVAKTLERSPWGERHQYPQVMQLLSGHTGEGGYGSRSRA